MCLHKNKNSAPPVSEFTLLFYIFLDFYSLGLGGRHQCKKLFMDPDVETETSVSATSSSCI